MNRDKEVFSLILKKGLIYQLDEKGRIKRQKPWLGDLFAFVYDSAMANNVFPKKFGASMEKHYEILRSLFRGVTDKAIVELAAGNGDAVRFLEKENRYTGVDISAGLLRQAGKKCEAFGFRECTLYVADAASTPLADQSFDIAICNLSMNFFADCEAFIREVRRILKGNGVFYASVPVPERKTTKSVIHGTLFTEAELKEKFTRHHFTFEPLPHHNGALLYFTARVE